MRRLGGEERVDVMLVEFDAGELEAIAVMIDAGLGDLAYRLFGTRFEAACAARAETSEPAVMAGPVQHAFDRLWGAA